MTTRSHAMRRGRVGLAIVLAATMTGGAAAQSMRTVDPSTVIDSDLDRPVTTPSPPAPTASPSPSSSASENINSDLATPGMTTPVGTSYAAPEAETAASAAVATNSATYKKDDLIGAAEGVFGKGAEGLAKLIENILRDQGEPNGYIVGREAGGALVLGVRYGSGTLFHKIEGQRPAYWTGPSIGFDAGANAAKTFVLVYNLYNSDDLYRRYPAGEGQAYLIGGFNASYLRRGDVVLIPIRVGVGARLGINAGYMKFRKKQNWVPF